MASSGFNVGVTIATKTVARELQRIQTKDIPAAKASAFSRAGSTAVSQAERRVASWLRIPKWQVAGVTKSVGGKKRKKLGGRIGRTKYVSKVDGIWFWIRTHDFAPGGTVHKARKLTATRKGVKAGKHLFPDAFAKTKNYPYPAVYKRVGRGLEVQRIKFSGRAQSGAQLTIERTVPTVFEKRFKHEFDRRMKRRGLSR